MTGVPFELRATHADRAVAARLAGFAAVGLDGLLRGERAGVRGGGARTRARARAVTVPGAAVSHGWRFALRDEWTGTWWPQGIAVGEHNGIPLALVSWYAQPRRGVRQGARITVVDLRDAQRPSYRHVLLVEARESSDKAVFDPVLAHAGGIAWAGDRLLVAATFDGIREFRLSDILRANDRARAPFGYEFVLPQASHHRALEPAAKGRMRYSFLTVETGGSGGAVGESDAEDVRGSGDEGDEGDDLRLVAGEYHRDDAHRVARLTMSGDTTLVGETHVPRVAQMQGVAVHDGTWFVSASRGERERGDLWSGPIDSLRRHAGALPPGPEALAVWPERGELWSVSEVRGKRWIFAVDLSRLS